MFYRLPFSYRDQIRHSKLYRGGSMKKTAYGFEYFNNAGLALKLTGGMVRNSYSKAAIRKAHFDRKNLGFTWIRLQDDPKAASDDLIARADTTRPPMLPMKERFARIKNALATGEVLSQRKLTKIVGNATDGYTVRDIRALHAMSVIYIRKVEHGQREYLEISLGVDLASFDNACRAVGQRLRQVIAFRQVDFLHKKQGRDPTSTAPQIELEDLMR